MIFRFLNSYRVIAFGGVLKKNCSESMLVNEIMRKTYFERLESETLDALKTMHHIQNYQPESDLRNLPAAKIQCIVDAHQRVRQSISLLVMAGSKLQSHQYWLRVYFLRYMNYANNQEAAYADQLKSLEMHIPRRSEKVNLVLSYLHKAISQENAVAVLSFIYVTEYCMNKKAVLNGQKCGWF